MLELLSQGPRTVEELARLAGISLANASQHLKVLRTSRLAESEKNGLYVNYRLADEQVSQFILALRSLAEARLTEVKEVTRAFLEARSAMESVGKGELFRRVRSGEVTLIDVRPTKEYQDGHIPGAISVPLEELGARLKDLPKRREIVAYCRGPYCVMAIEAVERLRKKGFRAIRMEQGVVDWKARGWRVETGPEKAKV